MARHGWMVVVTLSTGREGRTAVYPTEGKALQAAHDVAYELVALESRADIGVRKSLVRATAGEG